VDVAIPPRVWRAQDVLGFATGAALMAGALLPWTTATYLDDVESETGLLASAYVEVLAAGALVIVCTRLVQVGRLSHGAASWVAVLAVGVVVADAAAVALIAYLTGGSSISEWELGGGFWVVVACIVPLAVDAVARVHGRSRVLAAAAVATVVALALVIGAQIGDRVHDDSYDYSAGFTSTG
jgi:hypothetical protein